ncbi:MAG: hypothetical protein WCX65_19475 [bacterium]
MPDPELAIIIELPFEIDSSIFLTPVRDNKCPLDILIERLKKIVPSNDMIFLTGHESHHVQYGSFSAMNGLFLFRTAEPGRLVQFVRAASSRRMKTAIRINACHVFADPELLKGMLDFHNKQSVAYTCFDGIPAWLGGDIFERADVIDAFVLAEEFNKLDEDPAQFILSQSESFKTASYRPKVWGRWKNVSLSLDTPASAAVLIESIRRAPDPLSVSYRDFLE